jgi:hypothetical protein
MEGVVSRLFASPPLASVLDEIPSTARLPLLAAGIVPFCATEAVPILVLVVGLAFAVSLASNVLPGIIEVNHTGATIRPLANKMFRVPGCHILLG